MYSKNHVLAIIAVLLCASCSITSPWAQEPIGQEVNLSFSIRNNLLFLSTATIDGRSGRFLVGTAAEHSTIDNAFARNLSTSSERGPHALHLGKRASLQLAPVLIDLRGVADGIVGADAWGDHAISINYTSMLITFQKEGIHPELMTVYDFEGAPEVSVLVNGKTIRAIVDTTSPDTLVLPRGSAPVSRTLARVALAGTDLGTIDVLLADVSTPRLGNRILSKFLVTIDYGKHMVGLWRDPRSF